MIRITKVDAVIGGPGFRTTFELVDPKIVFDKPFRLRREGDTYQTGPAGSPLPGLIFHVRRDP